MRSTESPEFGLAESTSLRDASVRCAMWTERRLAIERDRPVRVLVVDDNETAAEALSLALAEDGYETRYVFGGVSAIQLVSHWVPDIIALDINMPEYDGFETAHLLRCLVNTRNAGIIAFTALSAPDVARQGLPAGFDAYCQKGCSLDAITGLIQALIVRRAV
ncbi:response regulator [Robbsia andropogonis]|nr:response regulator [Robbsia andropogonis]MCP1119488.1 response regulator [Robbsia andropogonis]MCP1129471.1 response regulator [Robbsia andropogonis]